MRGKDFCLTPLESRKQMLLVESELNRAHLLTELQGLKIETARLMEQMRALESLAATTAKLADTFSAIGNAFGHRASEETKDGSWISRILKSARTGVAIWGAVRSHLK